MKKIIFLATFLIVALFSCGSSTKSDQQQVLEPAVSQQEIRPTILISTPKGDIIIELYNETPLHRDNFLKLAEAGFYDQTLFHRVIRDFMIQGGDPDSKNAAPGVQLGMGGPGYTIPAEFFPHLIHAKGALSAARMGDQVNPQKESSGSQFYIVQGKVYTHEELDIAEQRLGKVFTNEQRITYTTVGGTPHLDGGYTVFGRVVDGMSVLDAIAQEQTDPANRPITDISMKMSVIKK
jgi:cyclophilin family peptidyl-prolyl cis-trans isomerase